MLLQGIVRPRPLTGRSQASPGIHPISPLTHRTQRFQPLPIPLGEPPYHLNLETVLPGITEATIQNGKIVFHTIGDSGGIKQPEYQRSVAALMKSDLNIVGANRPAFFYHLGDVVYYNGQISQYYEQFYEPYDHYDAPIFAIPGNHDGDPIDDGQKPLDGYVRYFMSPTPIVQPESQDAPRVTLSQPNCYFTLNCPFVTIVGMYTNVPEHRSIDSVQQQWLTHELSTAPTDRALIVALHHPIYSFDDHHSGSIRMADALQHAINDSRRVPNLVLTAHVHNYQRIEKSIIDEGPTPFIVAGNGGYYHLHGINVNIGEVDQETGARLVSENHQQHGYITLSVDKQNISGVMSTVKTPDIPANPRYDDFTYSATARFLPNNVVVSL